MNLEQSNGPRQDMLELQFHRPSRGGAADSASIPNHVS